MLFSLFPGKETRASDCGNGGMKELPINEMKNAGFDCHWKGFTTLLD